MLARNADTGILEEGYNLDQAIASATGISQGTAHTISTLLMPDLEVSQNSRTLIKRFPYHLFASDDEKECHKVCSTVKAQSNLWIRKDDLALVKYVHEMTSTRDDDEKMLESLKRIDSVLTDVMRRYLASRTDKERHFKTSCRYERVVFDHSIDQGLFTNLE